MRVRFTLPLGWERCRERPVPASGPEDEWSWNRRAMVCDPSGNVFQIASRAIASPTSPRSADDGT